MNVEPSFAKPNLSLVVAHREVLKKWRKLENSLRVARHSQTGSIGMDDSILGQLVELYNENANMWQAEKLVNYNFSKDGKDAQSYTVLIKHNDESIYGTTLPDEYIRFA